GCASDTSLRALRRSLRAPRPVRGHASLSTRNVHIPNDVFTGRQEPFEIGVAQDERRRVDVGMERNTCRLFQLSIEIDTNVMIVIVDQPEWRDRSGRHAKMFHQAIRRRETQLPVADLIRNGAEIGTLRVRQNHQIVTRALLVPQKQILAVHGVDAGPVDLTLLRRRNRRMLIRFELNAQARQMSADAFLLWRHGTSTAAPSMRPPRRSDSASLAR